MSKRTRRQFLEDSMFAAAAAVTATSTGQLFAQDEEESTSPNERLSVAVVGVKGRGGSHLGAFSGRKDTQVTYICDVDSEVGMKRVTEVGKRQGGREPKYVKDIRDVLEDKSVDIVSIATPNHWHALGAIWSIQAGKDVYVEKPVSHNVSEGRRIVEAARRHKKICQTGTQSRSNPGMIDAVKAVQGGDIGECKLARGLCYKPRGSIGPRGNYMPPETVDYNLWLGPAPLAAVTRERFHYDWHWQWPYGNGDLGNQGIHQMDLARWGLGATTLSDSVLSYGGRFGYEDAGDTANTQVVIHNFGEKSLVFEVRGLNTKDYKRSKVGVIFEGDKGYVVMTSYHSGAAFDRDGNMIKEFKGQDDHFGNFIKAVRSRKIEDLNADIEEGHLSSALCHTGNISYRLGSAVAAKDLEKKLAMIETADNAQETLERTLAHLKDNNVDLSVAKITLGEQLQFDPSEESFVDNDAADKMLTRQYRKPFIVPDKGNV